jgi:uncharacterized membrane protein YhaH (DUF805 family)
MIRDFRKYDGTINVHQFWNSFFSIFMIGVIYIIFCEIIHFIVFFINLTTNMIVTFNIYTVSIPIFGIISLAGLLPQMVRRLRDANHSWYYLLWVFVPILGWVFLTLALLESNLEEKKQ